MYATLQAVTTYATQAGLTSAWGALPLEQQKNCLYLATSDITQYLGVTVTGYTLDLKKACVKQTLHIAEFYNERKISERTKVLTDSSFSDGILTLGRTKHSALSDEVKFILDQILIETDNAGGVFRG